MKNLIFFSFLFCLLTLTSCASEGTQTSEATVSETNPVRIISLSGTLTEILYALDYGDQIVGVDVTSSYPAEARSKPQMGHISQLNVEGLLAAQPDIIFVDAEQADNQALNTVKEAGVNVVAVPMRSTLDNAVYATEAIAEVLEVPETAKSKIENQVKEGSAALAELVAGRQERPRVLFIYARGAGRIMVAGKNTDAAAIIEIAGGQNAITSFEDFKPLTPEALVEAAPEVILMFTSGLESLDGKAGLASIPGIAETPAYKQDRIIAMDGHYLISFGPRQAEAAQELAKRLFPNVSK
ncbi:hemin ABC transporter substrate-binding protein [Lewinella sp. W8]|uniref:heme/hemin ABC transporter substrate-binding protein n=1 Tax=Lewinella sp. W8 TaxID=2528208 RepID=UPI001068268E|nr:ABC transporter substrate-binding protein [Lewinella sp. W8]MTB53141.1 ABC transporter substrate-binding protein [Lewinella sp. W8]